MNPIIRIDKTDVITGCIIQPYISCFRYTTVRHINHKNSIILILIFLQNFQAIISTSIVYTNNFKIFIITISNRLQTSRKVPSCIVNWNNYRYQRTHIIFTSLLFIIYCTRPYSESPLSNVVSVITCNYFSRNARRKVR